VVNNNNVSICMSTAKYRMWFIAALLILNFQVLQNKFLLAMSSSVWKMTNTIFTIMRNVGMLGFRIHTHNIWVLKINSQGITHTADHIIMLQKLNLMYMYSCSHKSVFWYVTHQSESLWLVYSSSVCVLYSQLQRVERGHKIIIPGYSNHS